MSHESEDGKRRVYEGSPFNGRIRFERDLGIEPIEKLIQIPILRLHCPKATGASATETFADEGATETELTIKFPGINLGSTTETTVRVERSWSTENGRCLEIVYRARLLIEAGRFYVGANPYATVMSFTITDIQDTQRQRRIPPSQDRCTVVSDDDQGFTPIEEEHAIEPKAGTYEYTLSRTQQMAGTVGFDCHSLGVTASFRSATHERRPPK